MRYSNGELVPKTAGARPAYFLVDPGSNPLLAVTTDNGDGVMPAEALVTCEDDQYIRTAGIVATAQTLRVNHGKHGSLLGAQGPDGKSVPEGLTSHMDIKPQPAGLTELLEKQMEKLTLTEVGRDEQRPSRLVFLSPIV